MSELESCNFYSKLFLKFILVCLLVACHSEEVSREPIESIVRSDFHHGIPYTLVLSYDSSDAKKLVKLLESNSEKEYWPNIIWALGILGKPGVEEVLINFLEKRFSGEVDNETLNALLTVNQSLGFLAHNAESKAYKYLTSGTYEKTWQERNVQWTYPGLKDGDLIKLMIKLSINGLGLAANNKSINFLKNRQLEIKKSNKNIWPFVQHNFEDAIKNGGRIKELGYAKALSGSTF